MQDLSSREALTDAVRYWEPRRVVYNLGLVAVVVAVYCANLPGSRDRLDLDLAQQLFVLGVLANILYCSGYIADIGLQLTPLRPGWLRVRWGLLLIGFTFAAILAHFIARGLFTHPLHSA